MKQAEKANVNRRKNKKLVCYLSVPAYEELKVEFKKENMASLSEYATESIKHQQRLGCNVQPRKQEGEKKRLEFWVMKKDFDKVHETIEQLGIKTVTKYIQGCIELYKTRQVV